MLADMGLNRPPKGHELARLLQETPGGVNARTNEEKRVIVGIWYMSSSVALTFNKVEPARYTRYTEQCLAELEEAAEYNTDKLLAQLVRIQHLTQTVFQFNNKDHAFDELPSIPIPTIPVSSYVSAFQVELDRLHRSLPPELRTNYLIKGHYNIARLRLYERILMNACSDTTHHPFADDSTADLFHGCHAALTTFFDDWLSVPVCAYFYLPQPASGQLINGITMLCRWAKLTSPKNKRAVPELQVPEPQIDTSAILEVLATRFEFAKREMAAAHGGVWNNELWDLAARRLRMARMTLEKWSEIVAIVGGEGILLSKYHPAEQLGHFGGGEGHGSAGAGKGSTNGGPSETPLSNCQEGWQWASDIFEGMDLDQDFFFGGLVEWDAVLNP